jgi:hypothetical protein
MANLVKVVQQIRAERVQAQKKIEQLDEALRALTGVGGAVGRGARRGHRAPAKRRTMSTASRKRIAAAQRARWAKWKVARKSRNT